MLDTRYGFTAENVRVTVIFPVHNRKIQMKVEDENESISNDSGGGCRPRGYHR